MLATMAFRRTPFSALVACGLNSALYAAPLASRSLACSSSRSCSRTLLSCYALKDGCEGSWEIWRI